MIQNKRGSIILSFQGLACNRRIHKQSWQLIWFGTIWAICLYLHIVLNYVLILHWGNSHNWKPLLASTNPEITWIIDS